VNGIEGKRPELLGAALTIWRWSRQNAATLQGGRPLGSFEEWAEWLPRPLLALGCCDPVQHIDRIKADDPHRRRIVELFETWNAHHDERPIKAADLALPARALVDPQGRQQHIAARLNKLAGTPPARPATSIRPRSGAHLDASPASAFANRPNMIVVPSAIAGGCAFGIGRAAWPFARW
jgi:hypothetical protein